MTEGTIQIPEGKVGFDDETPAGEKNTKTKANKKKKFRISVCETQSRKVENKVLQTPFLFIAMIFFYLWRKVLSYHPKANLILKMTLLPAYVKNETKLIAFTKWFSQRKFYCSFFEKEKVSNWKIGLWVEVPPWTLSLMKFQWSVEGNYLLNKRK